MRMLIQLSQHRNGEQHVEENAVGIPPRDQKRHQDSRPGYRSGIRLFIVASGFGSFSKILAKRRHDGFDSALRGRDFLWRGYYRDFLWRGTNDLGRGLLGDDTALRGGGTGTRRELLVGRPGNEVEPSQSAPAQIRRLYALVGQFLIRVASGIDRGTAGFDTTGRRGRDECRRRRQYLQKKDDRYAALDREHNRVDLFWVTQQCIVQYPLLLK